MKPNIELHVGELILRGFKHEDRYRISEAVQTELSRLFAEVGVPPSLGRSTDRRTLAVGYLQLGVDPNAEMVGRRIAGALYEGFQPTTLNRERR